MSNYQMINSDEIKSVTRMNAKGKIIFTFPYIESIGTDISYQDHVRLSMKTHKIVVSDVFNTVQGFRTVAVHAPVFKNGHYDGTLAFLLSFDKIAQKYIENIRVKESGYGWVVSENGIEISSPFLGHIGKNVYETYKDFPEIISLINETHKGEEGVTAYHYHSGRDTSGENVIMHAVYKRVSFNNTFWSIVIATPEDEITATLSGFRTNLLFVIIALLLLFMIFMYLIVRFQVIVEEQRKRESVLTDLRESESRYRYLFEQNPVPMLIYELDGLSILAVNDAFVAHYGYSNEEALTMLLTDLYPKHEREKISDFTKTLKGHAYAGEWHHLKKDGTQIIIEAHSHRFSYECRASRVAVINDLTERKRIEESLKENFLKFKTLFEINPDAIFITDANTLEIYDCNQVACVMNGYSHEELIGRSINILHLEQTTKIVDDAEGRHQFIEYLQHHNSVTQESIHRRKDGTLFPIETSMCLLTLDGRQFVMGIDRDITERKRAEDELKKYHEHLEEMVYDRTAELKIAKERAESADRLKSAFLATMSHELRTPLNSIIGFTGILMKGIAGPLNDEQQKQLGMAKGSAHHLLDLINDVLDISKIEAGQLVVSFNTFDYGKTLKNIVVTVQPLAEKKEIKIQLGISNDVIEINSDERRIGQVLLNLINNAIKFTDHGTVKIDCQVIDGNVITKVIDTGIGIKNEDMSKLFKPFSQIDTGLTRNHDGTGLGLSISQKLIEKLNGTITVESEAGIGSIFTVTVPL